MKRNSTVEPAIDIAVSAIKGDSNALDKFSKAQLIEAYELMTVMTVIGSDERLPSAMAIVAERILKP